MKNLRYIYILWLVLHLCFLAGAERIKNPGAMATFWPFEARSELWMDYDLTEFAAYTIIIPLVIAGIYKVISSRM